MRRQARRARGRRRPPRTAPTPAPHRARKHQPRARRARARRRRRAPPPAAPCPEAVACGSGGRRGGSSWVPGRCSGRVAWCVALHGRSCVTPSFALFSLASGAAAGPRGCMRRQSRLAHARTARPDRWAPGRRSCRCPRSARARSWTTRRWPRPRNASWAPGSARMRWPPGGCCACTASPSRSPARRARAVVRPSRRGSGRRGSGGRGFGRAGQAGRGRRCAAGL